MIKTQIVIAATIILLSLNAMVYAQEIAPDFTLTDIDGNTFSLSDYRGKHVLLDFFATWCTSCLAEMPHFKEVQQHFGDSVVIISISVAATDTDEMLQQCRAENEMTWIVARDTADVAAAYGVTVLSAVFIINKGGYIQYEHIGGGSEASVLIEQIPEFPTALILPLLMMVTLITVIVFRRRISVRSPSLHQV